MIHIDGSEGGGQLLRSALSLSLVTGQRFRMTNIRGARKPRPGLMRQHLACVTAAAQVGDAAVDGAELGSQELVFAPGRVRAGDYSFAIGSGGSTSLVLQTLLPALWHAEGASTVRIEGGTHNPLAPPFEFIEQCFLPVLKTMSAAASVHLERPGFMQAGGGVMTSRIEPVAEWRPLELMERGVQKRLFARVLHAHLPASIAERGIKTAGKVLGWPAERFELRQAKESIGPGGAMLLGAEFENVCEIASGFAQMGRSAESIAEGAAKGLRNYLASTAPVGRHLADQLLLPMALGRGGVFRTLPLSAHSRLNMEVIGKFLPARWRTTETGPGVWQVECSPMKS